MAMNSRERERNRFLREVEHADPMTLRAIERSVVEAIAISRQARVESATRAELARRLETCARAIDARDIDTHERSMRNRARGTAPGAYLAASDLDLRERVWIKRSEAR